MTGPERFRIRMNLILIAMDRLFHLPGKGWSGELTEAGGLSLIDNDGRVRITVPLEVMMRSNATEVVLWVKGNYDHGDKEADTE